MLSDKPRRKAWRVTGVKRTRTHSVKLLADTAEEATQIASNPPYKLKVSDCVEDPPIRLPGGGLWCGWAADNDPIYENAGWNFIMGKNLNPRFNTKKG
jgi:hypothetical protein